MMFAKPLVISRVLLQVRNGVWGRLRLVGLLAVAAAAAGAEHDGHDVREPSGYQQGASAGESGANNALPGFCL
jgi:hypothetical protein